MVDLFNAVMAPIEWLVAWIMFGFHQGLTTVGMPAAAGWTWALSIVGLVIVMRAAMIPLFVKQIRASRKLQIIQPELQKIQKKYKGKNDPESRQAMTQETMELYKKEGTNPFSSCLPILVQSPFFFGLFQVLNGLDEIARGTKDRVGPISKTVAAQAESATVFGAQLSDTFLGANGLSTQIVTVVLIILMSATTFLTQRQLMTKNMPQSALDSPFAKQQKMLLYIFPIIFAVSGVNFPIGVLVYWFTTNVWSMTQQFYVIRRMPAPGSAAERAYHARLARKGKPVPGAAVVAEDDDATQTPQPGQRVQPKSKKRAKSGGKATGPAKRATPETPETPETDSSSGGSPADAGDGVAGDGSGAGAAEAAGGAAGVADGSADGSPAAQPRKKAKKSSKKGSGTTQGPPAPTP